MIEYHLQGLSVRDIAKKVRVSKNTVQTYITKYRNNELLQLNLFSEENLKKKIRTPMSSQSRQKFYRPQEHHTYHINQEPKKVEQYYLGNNQEYKLREREKEKDEQARKSDREKLYQLKMKSYLMRQETERQKQQKTSDFRQKLDQDKLEFRNEQFKKKVESNKKIMARIRDLEEKSLKKEQHNQQLIDSIPKLVRKEMNKFQVLQQACEYEIQRDKDEHLESTFPQSKQAKENVNTESDYSDILERFVYDVIPVACKSIRFHLSQDNNIPINSPEYWIRLSKYLKNDRKQET